MMWYPGLISHITQQGLHTQNEEFVRKKNKTKTKQNKNKTDKSIFSNIEIFAIKVQEK